MQRTTPPIVERVAAAEPADARDRVPTSGPSYVEQVLFGRRRTAPPINAPELGAGRARRADRADPRHARAGTEQERS
jgi:hypothetical protein